MRPKPPSAKKKAVDMWLDGNDYRTIREHTGIGIGTQSEIISEARKSNPDLDELRQLNKLVKENNVAVNRAMTGLRFLADLQALRINEDNAAQAIARISSCGEEAPKILAEAKTLLDLEKQTGMKYFELVRDYRRKAESIAELTEKRETLKDECEKLQSSILDQKGLQRLQDRIQRHNIPIEKLDQFIENNLKLEENGFTLTVAETLSSELSKNEINPRKAAEILAESISKYQTLGRGITDREQRLEYVNGEIDQAEQLRGIRKSTLDAVEKDIEAKNNRLGDLEAGMMTRIKRLESEYEYRKALLEAQLLNQEGELKKRIDEEGRNLKKLIQQAEEEPRKRKDHLENDNRTLTNEIRKKRNEKEQLQRDVESLQATIKTTQKQMAETEERVKNQEPLVKLNALLTDPNVSLQRENLEPLIVILNHVVGVSGLGNIWGVGYPRGMLDSPKVKRGKDFIQDLVEELRKE